MRYRYLEEGDTIERGDEFEQEDGSWEAAVSSDGSKWKRKFFRPARRKLPPEGLHEELEALQTYEIVISPERGSRGVAAMDGDWVKACDVRAIINKYFGE